MARTHGKSLDLSLDGQAIEADIDTFGITFNVPESEITAFADPWGNFLAGKKDVTATLSGAYNTAANLADEQVFEAIGSGPVTMLADMTGSGPDTNDPVYTCTASGLTGALVTNYSVSLPVGDKATLSASLQMSGSTTRAVS
tara:strand:- start:571 stop:996 length:426 start_codon:yes stop_codon:yes gene_type:complete